MIQIPNALDPGATAEERQDFDDACRVADLQLRAEALKQNAAAQTTRDFHALAQSRTADGVVAAAEAQQAFTEAMREPDPLPTIAQQKQAAVIQLLSTQARGNRKPATFVADVREQVEAIFAALPTSTGV